MVKAIINGREIAAEKGATILDVALENGIDIPHFCDHPMLEKYGGCRMCLVKVKDIPKLVTSCTLKLEDGMVIETETPEVIEARKAVMEFLMIHHPLDCPTCDKATECTLQDYSLHYGGSSGMFEEEKHRKGENISDPLIVRNMDRCIMCTRCVRVCAGVQGANTLSPVGRGRNSSIEPFAGKTFECDYCGSCITLCPVGALMPKLDRYGCRPWEVESSVQSVCTHCGVGCRLTLQAKEGRIQRVKPLDDEGRDEGILCARGFFGYGFIGSPARLSTPLIREKGQLRQASWEEALSYVAERLLSIKHSDGGFAIAGIVSTHCTNEDGYMFQKFMRAALGSNNVDSTARLGIAGSRPYLEAILGSGVTATSVSDVYGSDAVLVMGGDPVTEMPVLGVMVRRAFIKGAPVITFGHTPGLNKHQTVSINPRPDLEWPAVAALLAQVLKQRDLPGDNWEIEHMISRLELPGPEDAKDYYSAEAIADIAGMLKDKSAVTIIVGRGAAASKLGPRNLLIISALSYALGARILLTSEGPNENGLLDMGCIPDSLPGGVSLEGGRSKRKFDKAWGRKIPSEPGMTLMEMFEEADAGWLKAMYIMGSNPAFSLPNSGFVRGALEKLDLLVVQDAFMTETAQMADVVLPSAGWAEKEGTYTNVERRIQHLDPAISGDGRQDWRILSDLAALCGIKETYSSAEDIMAEAARLSPLHSGLTYAGIKEGSGQWPYMCKQVTGGDIPDIGILYKKLPQLKSQEYYLLKQTSLFNAGTLNRHSDALMRVCPEATLDVNAETAGSLGLIDGGCAEVSTDQGAVELTVRVVSTLPVKTVAITNINSNLGIMDLFKYKPASRISTPYTYYSDLKIRSVSRSGEQAQELNLPIAESCMKLAR